MTRKEYQNLANQTIEVNAQEYHNLKCKLHALGYFGQITNICPRCYEAYLVNGYRCLNCGYDSSIGEEE